MKKISSRFSKPLLKPSYLQKEDIEQDYSIIYNTLQKDPSSSEMEAVQYIYRQLRGTDPPDEETARGIIDKLFFSDKRYNLGEVGRYKINRKLNLEISTRSIGTYQRGYYRDR
jgi:DNA-directed RNA polymerase subunit beta